jgi:hypothetical protein
MLRSPLALFALAVLAAAAGRADAAIVPHILDDGTAEFTTGFSPPGGSVVFVNRFDTVPGGELIQSISVAYGLPGAGPGAVLPGTPLQVILFRDALGRTTPTQPVLLASAPTQVTNPNTNTFIEAPIAPTFVAGSFFVGVLVSNLPPGGVFPIGFDRTDPDQGQSFAAFYSVPIGLGQVNTIGFNPNLTTSQGLAVNSNTFLRVVDGDYMIRATGLAVPEPTALGLAGIGAALALIRRRRQPAGA